MSRRFTLGAVLFVALTWAFVPSTPSAQSAARCRPSAAQTGTYQACALSRLSRGPDRIQLHGRHLGGGRGRIQSSPPDRQHGARDVSAFLARRPLDRVFVEPVRQQRRVRGFRRAAARRASSRSSPAADDVVGWSRDGQQVLFRSAHGDGAFPNVATLYQVAVAGGPEKPLPMDWGYYGDFSPDGKSLVFNRHPATWTRKHYRGSYAADLWIADLAQKTYRQLLPDDQFNRYWPMWGSDNNIYFVADPLPNEKNVKPGALEVYKSANNIYRVPVRRRPARADHETHERQSFLAVDVGRRQDDRLRGELRRLEARRRIGPDDGDQDRRRDRRQGKRIRSRDGAERSRLVRSVAVRPARGHLGPRPDPDDRDQPRRHHAHRARHHGVAQPVAEVVAGRQVHRVRLGQVRPRRDLDDGSGRQDAEADHQSRQREGRDAVDAGLEGAALHRRRQEALQLFGRGRRRRRR